jgi:hypothetical protein
MISNMKGANGVVYNAKGDLGLNGTVFANDVTPSPGNANPTVTFNSDGTITQSGNNGTGTATQWVETGPTPPAWQGGANYTISWTVFGDTAFSSPNANGSATLGSPQIFSLFIDGLSTNPAQVTYSITITNDAPGTQIPESIIFILSLDAEVP